jgi:hypothetical protein
VCYDHIVDSPHRQFSLDTITNCGPAEEGHDLHSVRAFEKQNPSKCQRGSMWTRIQSGWDATLEAQ